jgi:arginase
MERTYRILGVPLRAGSLVPGTEDDARAYRDAHLCERMREAGCRVIDDGDVAIPSYLPHHAVAPIRNWPGPRIVWDSVSEQVAPCLRQSDHVPLLIGCDCSIVVGTAQALLRTVTEEVYVIYVDGDCDDAPPDSGRCQSAAALAVWLLTHPSPFWEGPPLEPSHMTLLGWSNPSRSPHEGMGSLSLADVRRVGPEAAAHQVLRSIPTEAAVILHLDIDVFREQDLPIAYFPHADGLTMAEGRELLGPLLRDPRIRIIELAEYASIRDPDNRGVDSIIDLLIAGLARWATAP